MNGIERMRLTAICAALVGLALTSVAAGQRLHVEFGEKGISALRYGQAELLVSGVPEVHGVTLAETFRDRNAEPQKFRFEDPASVAESMYATDDRALTQPKGGGELVDRRFDAETRTAVLKMEWGRVKVNYEPKGNRLDFRVEVQNRSGRVIEWVDMQLLRLAMPGGVETDLIQSKAMKASSWNIGGPDLIHAEYGRGHLLWLSEQPNRPMRQRVWERGERKLEVGFDVGHEEKAKEVYDGVWNCRPIKPGENDVYELSLRFVGADADRRGLVDAASDVLRGFAEAHPPTLDWPDRRPIGAVFMTSSPDVSPANPRGWSHAARPPRGWDVREEGSHERFKQSLLDSADRIVESARLLGLQGVVLWDFEGREYSDAVYYGEPRILPHVAPEMDAAADEFFGRLTEAGLRVGLTVRPKIHFPKSDKPDELIVPWSEMTDLWARNFVVSKFGDRPVGIDALPEETSDLYNPAEAWSGLARLSNKIAYAKERWGCTLFYIDTPTFWRPRRPEESKSKHWSFRLLPADVLKRLQQRHPDVLILPEHEYLEYWAHGAPYEEPPRASTGPIVRTAYPEAFTAMRPGDGTERRQVYRNLTDYVGAVEAGDTFLIRAPQSSSELTERVFKPAAALAPFRLRVGAEELKLNGRALDGVGALRRELSEAIDGNETDVAARRVFLIHADGVSPDRRQAVVEAVSEANGIVAWAQPADPPGGGWWAEGHPLRAASDDVAASLFEYPRTEKGVRTVIVTNRSSEERVASLSVDYEALGLNASGPEDVAVRPAERFAAETEEEAADSSGSNVSNAQPLDATNLRHAGNTIELRVGPSSHRVIRIRAR